MFKVLKASKYDSRAARLSELQQYIVDSGDSQVSSRQEVQRITLGGWTVIPNVDLSEGAAHQAVRGIAAGLAYEAMHGIDKEEEKSFTSTLSSPTPTKPTPKKTPVPTPTQKKSKRSLAPT